MSEVKAGGSFWLNRLKTKGEGHKNVKCSWLGGIGRVFALRSAYYLLGCKYSTCTPYLFCKVGYSFNCANTTKTKYS